MEGMAILWLIALILAFAPALAFLLYIRRMDKYEPEPWGLMGRAFFAGCLAVLPALVIETMLGRYKVEGSLGVLWTAFVVAALVEESCKGGLAFAFMWRRPEFNEVMDGIVYFGVAHMGFAVMENLGYIFLRSRGNIVLALINAFGRATTAVPLHIISGMIMGYHVGMARYSRTKLERLSHFLRALLIPILLHGIYDWAAFEGELKIQDSATLLRTGFGTALLYAAVVLLWLFLLPRVRAAQEASPFRPHDRDSLPVATTNCARCGGTYPMGAHFCHQCGSPVVAGQSAL
jgi:RsiW-degrading membrane proteinase PrsW (M82 family)